MTDAEMLLLARDTKEIIWKMRNELIKMLNCQENSAALTQYIAEWKKIIQPLNNYKIGLIIVPQLMLNPFPLIDDESKNLGQKVKRVPQAPASQNALLLNFNLALNNQTDTSTLSDEQLLKLLRLRPN